MSIILIGYRGSGKTTVGRKLGRRLGRPFVDADDRIIEKVGKTIREIFAQQGESAFRDIEATVVAELADLENHVIGLGGGALGRAENARAIADKNHQIVYLHCEPAELLRRIQADVATSDNRPNLTALGGGMEEIQKMLGVREPIYKSNMTVQLDVTHLTPDQAVEKIVGLFE
jgi:shikimate kinase